MILTSPYLLYYTACFTLIVAGLICGAVRWFHMCEPYDKESEIYYPGRKMLTFVLVFQIMLIPYLFNPYSPDTWLYVRVFSILYYTVCSTMLMYRYFSGIDRQYKGMKYNIPVAIIPSAILIVLFVYACIGGNSLYLYHNTILIICGTLGVLVMILLCYTLFKITKRINTYSDNTYSNEDNFPSKFASQSIAAPLIITGIGWMVFLSDSQIVKMYMDIIVAVFDVMLVIKVLHPQIKNKDINENEEIKCDEVNKLVKRQEDTVTDTEHIYIERMDLLFTEKQLFLNPNLTIMDVANAIGMNRTYTSALMCKVHGSFIDYVNFLRIEYSEQLAKDNPEITQTELFKSSGFNNRNSYIKWKKNHKISK